MADSLSIAVTGLQDAVLRGATRVDMGTRATFVLVGAQVVRGGLRQR